MSRAVVEPWSTVYGLTVTSASADSASGIESVFDSLPSVLKILCPDDSLASLYIICNNRDSSDFTARINLKLDRLSIAVRTILENNREWGLSVYRCFFLP
jgi:hypothetical protein